MLTSSLVVAKISAVDPVAPITTLFNNLALKRGVKNEKIYKMMTDYLRIQDDYAKGSGTINSVEFQKFYCYYYKLRFVSPGFKTEYFEIMDEINSGTKYYFEDIAARLDPIDGKHQFSFITKLMHTTDDRLPIYDSLVAKNLAIKHPKTVSDRLAILQDMIKLYADLAADPAFLAMIKEFDDVFPLCTRMSFAKKCDFILWAL